MLDLGSEYRLSNALGRGVGIDSIILPGNGRHQGITHQVFFFQALPPPGGSRPHAPLTKNHKPRVGPAHMLSSVIYTTIPSRRPSVKDIVGYVKKFISFYFDRGSCIMSLNVLYKIN